MPRQGWIKLHRSLVDNPIWLQKPFSEGQAWVDLLMMAAHEDHSVNGVEWKAGTVRLSKKWLMERWGWTRWKIDNTLKRWVEDGMVQHTIQRTNQHTSYTVLTIAKWGFFQLGEEQNQRTNQHTNQQQHKKTNKFYADGGALDAPSSAAEKKTRWYRDESGELRWEVVDE